MGGDFNCHVSDQNELNIVGDDFLSYRSSPDTYLSPRGKKLLSFLGNNELIILNGRTKSDSPANFTISTGKHKSVIDLVCISYNSFDICKDLFISDLISSSDHFPAVLELNLPDSTSPFPPNPTKRETLKRKNLSSNHYTESMKWLDNVNFFSDDVSDFNDNFISSIHQVSDKRIRHMALG